MRKYNKPKIKVIQLDVEQAILQICKTGGKYFVGTNNCVYMTRIAPPIYCPNSVKGVKNLGYNVSQEENMPS